MDKPVWQSKTIWAAALLVAYAGAKYLAGWELPIPAELVNTVLAGLGLYGLRDAIGNGKKK